VTIASGTNNASVTFSSALPSASYRVALNPTGATAGYTPNDNCFFFNAASKTTTGFTVEHRRCDTGILRNVDPALALDWMAIVDN
jgi:hypothetical protein